MGTRQTDHHRRQLVLRAVVTILIATVPVSSMAQEVDAGDLPSVVVRVDNVAAVSATNLQFAEARAADVFGRVGAHLRWVDEDSVIREQLTPSFTIVLASGKDPTSLTLREDVLGFASPQGHRAYVLYGRIEALSERSQRSTASLLGDAMAHELGHLLLSTRGHSAEGIMRRDVDIKVGAIQTFTRVQAREIVSRLRQMPDRSGIVISITRSQ